MVPSPSGIPQTTLRHARLGVREPFLRSRQRGKGRFLAYERDPFLLCDEGHVWILDLETQRTVRFRLWPHQRRVIEAWIDLPHLAAAGELRFRNTHLEKSRQMGMTWVVAYVAAWVLNFHPVAGFAISRKVAEIADSGPTTDSFFGRIKFIHDRLPRRFRAPLIFTGGNDPSIRHPLRPQQYLAGEGANLDPGRGGKYTWVFLDEAARIPWGRRVHSSLSRACPSGRFYNSTPKGEDDLYFWLRDTRPKGYTFLREHWSVNPVYRRGIHVSGLDPDEQPDEEMRANAEACLLCPETHKGIVYDPNVINRHRYVGKLTSPWYEQVVAELTNEAVAEELDIDYTGSLPARIYTEFTDELHTAERIPLDYSLPPLLSWDYGWGTTAVGVWQRTATELQKIGEWEGGNLVPEDVVANVKQVLLRLGMPAKDLLPFNTLNWLCVGDPAGDAHSAKGRPLTADYRAEGFNIVSRFRSIDATITATKRALMGKPVRLVFSRETCPASIRHFKNNTWPVDRSGNRKPNAKEPENDEHNHMCRADAYLITHLFPPPSVTEVLGDPYDERRDSGHLDDLPGYDDVL